MTAIERNPAALRLLDENRQHFACANIDIFPGVAPMTIAEKADAIFMGGSGGHLTELIDWSMRQLHPAGRLVMTFILQKTSTPRWHIWTILAYREWIACSYRFPRLPRLAVVTISNRITPYLLSPVRRKETMSEIFDPRSVWFVGAGHGDRELITLKGYRLLQQAQVVIYAGSLINTELLEYCPAGAECHDSAELHLEQILDLMEAGVKAGKTVVRLQTGDVSLYGSVREQGEELTKRGIDWQVVPGVSAFLVRRRSWALSIPCLRSHRA